VAALVIIEPKASHNHPTSWPTGREKTTLVADLNNRADLTRVEDVLRSNTAITMLVNNAGFGSAIPLLEADISKMGEMIGLNVTALTRLTYAAVPGFCRARWRNDHQHRIDRRRCTGVSQWRL
jgi:short-subunit dehydrogenase